MILNKAGLSLNKQVKANPPSYHAIVSPAYNQAGFVIDH